MGNCCGNSPEEPPNPERIDLTHFELLKVVGKGGFGKVNAIQRKGTNELMALKRMSKCEVVKKESHIRMVWIERNIMCRLDSNFLVNLEHAFQSDKELFLVMPFMQGGDLRFHLSKRGTMSEEDCKFYTAEMVLGLESMHRLHIIYRDMKPDNILLDSEGHLRLSDFGLSVELQPDQNFKMKGNAGTSGYLAPEVMAGEKYSMEPDVWSFGVTVYELLHGCRPFRSQHDVDYTRIKFRTDLSTAGRAFITACLQPDPSARIACAKGGMDWKQVKDHPWLASIDWGKIERKEIDPPIRPDLDQANCNNQADLADQLIDRKPEPIPPEAQKHFVGFDFGTDIAAYQRKKLLQAQKSNINNTTSHNDDMVLDQRKIAPASGINAETGMGLTDSRLYAPPSNGDTKEVDSVEMVAKKEGSKKSGNARAGDYAVDEHFSVPTIVNGVVSVQPKIAS